MTHQSWIYTYASHHRSNFENHFFEILKISVFDINFIYKKMSCNRIVVSTSRCGRDNPGSNPGYSIFFNPFIFVKNIWSADWSISKYLFSAKFSTFKIRSKAGIAHELKVNGPQIGS